MLSRVLSGRDTERAQPVVFACAEISIEERRRDKRRSTDGSEEENRAAREAVRGFEARLASARHESFEAGSQQGEQRARAELTPVLERLSASIAEVTGMRDEMRRRAEKDVVQLSLLIAKRVLHRELSVDPNALTALARVVFERLARSESYQVQVHPRFASAVRAALPGSQTARVHIEPDPDCAPGALVIRSEEGLIDASVEAQLEEITRGLTDRLIDS